MTNNNARQQPAATKGNASSEREKVIEFLRANPHFFESQPTLLHDLIIPHQEGQSVSLIQRQVLSLRTENGKLQEKLSLLINNARDNEALFDKTRKLTLSLIEANEDLQIYHLIEQTMRDDFNADFCKVWRLENEDAAENHSMSHAIAAGKLARLVDKDHPYCGLIKSDEAKLLFGSDEKAIGSAAILGVFSSDELVAIIAIASKDKNYYRNNMSTTLLDYIGNVVARVLAR